jgi:hypothetical protein
MKTIALTCVLAITACAAELPYGAIAPSRSICKLGGFHQELSLTPDFRIDRVGDDAYPSDDRVRAFVANDARAIAKYSKCPGTADVGTMHVALHRIESGTSRSGVGKALAWVLFIIPSFGLSSIYPLSERRWLRVELDADVMVADHKVWSGEFTSFESQAAMRDTDMADTGAQITALIARAQDAAVKELKTALEWK